MTTIERIYGQRMNREQYEAQTEPPPLSLHLPEILGNRYDMLSEVPF
jgi:hypothetical protein